MLGTPFAVKQSLVAVNHLILKEKKTYKQAFSDHVRLRYASRSFLNNTIYNGYDGPVACLAADRCMFEHPLDRVLSQDQTPFNIRFGPSGRCVLCLRVSARLSGSVSAFPSMQCFID